MKTVLLVALLSGIVGAAWSITDEDFIQMKVELAEMKILTKKVADLEVKNRKLEEFRAKYETKVDRLETKCGCDSSTSKLGDEDFAQNVTIEERVTLLELSMVAVQDEVAELEDEVAFLFDEQVLQDERILTLEQDTAGLDDRVEVLEAGGGSGGNVTALEERVETLEGTAADHEADIEDLESVTSNLDGRMETMEGQTSELESRLTAAETQIEDLQVTDVQLDARITVLEGVVGNVSATIAFHAVTEEEDITSIPDETNVIFSTVLLNVGNGYDPATGVFTVPSDGAGYYFLTTYSSVDVGEYAYIDIRVNGNIVCTGLGDNSGDGVDYGNAPCSAAVFLNEGDEVTVVNNRSWDSTPLFEINDGPMNGFTGFRI